MNYKALINAFLIILLLHLLIKNIQFKKIFNWTKEQFTDYKESINFLLDTPQTFSQSSSITSIPTSIPTSTPSCYNELMDYVKECDNSEQIKAGNYYVEDENSPNFISNVMNVHKFYDRNSNSYDGLDISKLSEKEYTSPDKVKEQECFPPRNLHDNYDLVDTKPKPDNWNYKNELPMNGGSVVGNVVGYDTLNEGFSTFSENVNMISSECNSDMYFDEDCKTKPDDIRFGLGYPNEEIRATT